MICGLAAVVGQASKAPPPPIQLLQWNNSTLFETGEGNVRTSGVYQTGEACGTKEKEDDVPASRQEDEKMSGERRRIIQWAHKV